jgi:hypothetical protein
MRKITYTEDNKLANIIKQLDLIDPSRLYQSIGKYECLLKSIKNKNNYVFDILFESIPFEMYVDEFLESNSKLCLDKRDMCFFLIDYAAKHNNLHSIQKLTKYYYPTWISENFSQYINFPNNIDIIAYLAIKYQDVNIIKANVKRKYGYIGFPLYYVVDDDSIPDLILSKILQVMLQYNNNGFINQRDETILKLMILNKTVSMQILIQAKKQYDEWYKRFEILYINEFNRPIEPLSYKFTQRS